jgi:ABC-type lipoprotein release transport system permease subunit
MLKIKNTVKRFVSEKKAEGFLDVAMKILIVVVIGAAILLIMNAAMPDLFQNLIDKISGELTGVNILP